MGSDLRRLLVLGAGGRLGRLLRRHWSAHPPPGTRLHFQSRGALPGTGPDPAPHQSHQWAPGDAMTALPECDAIIALWGATTGDPAALAVNSDLAGLSHEIARHCGADRVLHLSSAAIYGPARQAREATPPAPLSPYGRAKLEMEARIVSFTDAGTSRLCLRLANVVGADSLAPALRRDGPVTLDRFADGTGPRRSYIGPGDLGDVLIALTRLPAARLPAVLNVAAPQVIAMEALARAAGKDVIWRAAPDRALQEASMEISALSHLLSAWQPETRAPALIAQWRALEGTQGKG